MTKTLEQRLEEFDNLSDGNRRVWIHRLKAKKAKYETELGLIEVILERYTSLKKVRFAKRIADLEEAYRNGM